MPNNINLGLMLQFHEEIIPAFPDQLRLPLEEASRKGWSFYVTDISQGHCKYATKEIVIPVFAIKEPLKGQHRAGYLEWYTAHELAHAYDFMNGTFQSKRAHGTTFMKLLEVFCPKEFLVYEINYKPRNVKSSGIILMEI